MTQTEKKTIRWWPVKLILALDVVALLVIWFGIDVMRHLKNLLSFAIILLTILALLFWTLFLSRMRWKTRGAIFGVFFLVTTFLLLFVRVRGMTGDWIPILAWSWTPETELSVDPARTDASAALAATGGDVYPQFAGPRRDSRLPKLALARDFEASPPQLLWRQEIGAGWSGFVVADGLAITQEQRGPDEFVTAYELTTGNQVWAHSDTTRFDDNAWMGGVGPRATPTIADGKVYAAGATGIVNCLDLKTGEKQWSVDVVKEFDGRRPEWGYSSAPLVLGDKVIVGTGAESQSLVALDRETGEKIWGAGDDQLAYSSPFLVTLAGVPQIVMQNRESLAGHDPEDGRVLWTQVWDSNGGLPTAAQPLPLNGNQLLASAAYGIGSRLFEISNNNGNMTSSLVWETPRYKAKFTQMIDIDGTVYGLNDGVMSAFDLATAERLWKRGRYGHGQTSLIGDDLFLVSGEKGDVILVEPSREGLKELSRFKAMDGKVWNPHALAGPYLLIRTDLEAACYKLALEDTPAGAGDSPEKVAQKEGQMIPIETPKGTFNVWTQKHGDNPDIKVLLLHGGPGATHEYLEIFQDHFPGAGFEFYFYDQLGSMHSDQPDEPELWETARFVEEVEQVRQALGLNADNFYLYGQSWGGILAIEYALKYQENVKGLIISNMMASIPAYNDYAANVLMPDMDQDVLAEIKALEANEDYSNPRYLELLMEHHYVDHVLRMPSGQWPDSVLRGFDHINPKIYVPMQGPSELGASGKLADWDRVADLPKIKIPTLVIGAAHDTMDPTHMKMMADAVQNGRYLECPNGSHLAMYDDTETYFQGLIGFIRDIDNGA